MGQCQSVCSHAEQPLEGQPSTRIEYDGDHFIIPQEFTFQKQATFAKVEAAARSFCTQNNISLFYTPVVTRIIAYRNEFIFQQIWNQLEEGEREEFLEDLNSIQHDLMDSFYHNFVKKISQLKSKPKTLKISQPKYTKQQQISQYQRAQLKEIGVHLINDNRVAMVLMCAGSSSRFDTTDKFLYPLDLSSEVTILDLVFMRLKKTTSNRNMPIIINCNEYNIEKVQNYFKDKSYYGFSSSMFRYTITYSLAVFDKNGKYCLNQNKRLLKRPSGTASCAQTILNSTLYNFLKLEGIQYLYFSGMQNILQNPCDPILLGIMKTDNRKIAAKCVSGKMFTQNLPRYYCNLKNNNIQLLTTYDFDRLPNKQLINCLPIATNSMAFQLNSLVDIMKDYSNSLLLAEKYHILRKKQKIYNFKFFKVEDRECMSFEKDLRDIITCDKNALLYKVSRENEYAPICTKSQAYALSEVLQHYQKRLNIQLKSNSTQK